MRLWLGSGRDDGEVEKRLASVRGCVRWYESPASASSCSTPSSTSPAIEACMSSASLASASKVARSSSSSTISSVSSTASSAANSTSSNLPSSISFITPVPRSTSSSNISSSCCAMSFPSLYFEGFPYSLSLILYSASVKCPSGSESPNVCLACEAASSGLGSTLSSLRKLSRTCLSNCSSRSC